THGGENTRVVAAGRIAEEIDRHAEPAPDPRARACNLVSELGGAKRRQVEVVDRVGVDLPALADHQPDLRDGQLAVEQVADGEVEHAGPVATRKQWPNVREVL